VEGGDEPGHDDEETSSQQKSRRSLRRLFD